MLGVYVQAQVQQSGCYAGCGTFQPPSVPAGTTLLTGVQSVSTVSKVALWAVTSDLS